MTTASWLLWSGSKSIRLYWTKCFCRVKISVLTWAWFLVCIQHEPHSTLALKRVSVADADVLTGIIILCARVQTCDRKHNSRVDLRPPRCNELLRRWGFPTRAGLLIRVQGVSSSTLAGVRAAAGDTQVLTVVTPSASVKTSRTWGEDGWLYNCNMKLHPSVRQTKVKSWALSGCLRLKQRREQTWHVRAIRHVTETRFAVGI